MDESSSQVHDELNAILRQALPEAWRHAAEATLIPEGLAFRFRDADGRLHALDARPRDIVPSALVTGNALGYSYTVVDPAVDDVVMLDEYRTVLTALAARENELLPWLTATAATLPWRGPQPGERPAPTELVSILRGELPEAWRHDLTVSLTQGGFVLRFVDDAGVHHALDAREIRPESPTLVSGRTLAFSYLFVEGGAEETALAGEYRAVLSRLAAREGDLLPWIDPTAPGDGPSVTAPVSEQAAEALPDEHPAHPALAAITIAALPEAWRHAVETTLSPRGFLLRFRDADGRRHALEARDLRSVATPFVAGGALGYSYTLVDPALDAAAVLDGYRAVLTALAAREADLLPWLELSPDESAGRPDAAPDSPSWKGPFPNETAAPPEFTAIVLGTLPEPWQHDMAAVITEAGFTVRFRDEKGARHAFDAREIRSSEPALVSGRVLSFSHASLEEGADETPLPDAHRTALSALAAREDDFLPWLSFALQHRALPTLGLSESAWKGPFPNEQPASPELEAITRAVLPDAWRHDLAVSLTPGGFILRFRDARGLRHAFDARPASPGEPTLVSGRTLAFSYLCLEVGTEETALAGEYRTALAALAAREDDILPWLSFALQHEALPTLGLSESAWKGPFPNEQPASPELEVITRSVLPDAWRHDLAVSLTPGGFILRFRDARGLRHAFDARPASPGEPTLVSGRTLAFSYLCLEVGTEETALAGEYRTALAALAAREDDLLPWLALPPGSDLPQDHATPPPNDPLLPSAPPELVAIVRGALPDGWQRELTIVRTPNGLVVRVLDPQGARRAFDLREVRADEPALVSGHALAFSYLSLDDELEDVDRINDYRTILGSLAAREDALLPWLGTADVRGADAEDARRPTPTPFRDLLAGLLPPDWRTDVAAVIIVDGFTLGFRDDAGVRHKIEGRLLKGSLPSLVRGEQLGFSYRKIDPALDESAMVQRYREVLKNAFCKHENQLVAEMMRGTA